jgi:hypothetical protein
MQKIIQGWVHRPGKHCASTVLSDLAHFYGHGLSEAFCLGLGAGLGFFYLEGEALTPTRMLMTRSQDLEGNFFRNLGIRFEWKTEQDPKQGWKAVKECIDRNIPVLLRADIFHLDHYQSKTHFPLHVILLWGYDDGKQSVFIADTGFEGLMEIPMESLSKARYSRVPVYSGSGEFFPVVLPKKIKGLDAKAKKAIKLQAKQLEANDGFQGMEEFSAYGAIRKVSERIFSWPEAKDASWCFRWAYQIIERRGTGGGAFRKLYADFLKEAAKISEEIAQFAPASEMEMIGGQWSQLSMLLKEMSEKNPVAERDLKKVSAAFRELAEKEESFFDRASKRL